MKRYGEAFALRIWMGDRCCGPWQGVEKVLLLPALLIAFEPIFSSMDVQDAVREE